jgi:hypothetical protein
MWYRITMFIDGQPVEGKPVDKETVERTVSTFLENGFPQNFKIEKIEQRGTGAYTLNEEGLKESGYIK